jgi:serralysin
VQEPGSNAGPPYQFTTELMGEYSTMILKDQALLTRTDLGYRYWSGGQNNHIVVTLVEGGLKFRDTATKSFKKLSPHCTSQTVKVGISAVCHVPDGITTQLPLLVEIWPRLGDDYVDARTLPDTYAVTVLSDEGNDVAYLGAGPDFFNGHSTRDKVWGGAGNDWIRAGLGNDRIGGNVGTDHMWAELGNDWVLCGGGPDRVENDAADRVFPSCEAVKSR